MGKKSIIPHQSDREAAILAEFKFTNVFVVVVEVSAPCVGRIFLRSTPPVTVSTLAVETTIFATITTPKCRKPTSVIFFEIYSD
jgi:hypothetical protein